MDISMVGKKSTPSPGLSRMYIVNIVCWQLVTIHIMRGSVPRRDACFQSLMNDALWNMRNKSGNGMAEQECAWMRWHERLSCGECKAGRYGRGDNFVLIAATDSPQVSSLPCPFPSPFPSRLSPENHVHCSSAHIAFFWPRMPLESIATLFRYYHARKDFKRLLI